ncbi:MAG: PQQ-dependent sugar dehydrogenase, partial [Armatimonadota bacterium]|nr:PQQ-dependent sugar dehydrogenase [Armatimonadota bacterium]
ATGDGGSRGDPWNHAQNVRSLLGKLLRIDVDSGRPYTVPPDNPFAGRPDARPEIWTYGLRNPWRFSFDRCDGRLFLADVGQGSWEEINVVQRGGNYGWRIMEGTHCFNPPSGCRRQGLIRPIAEYRTSLGCAVIGGYVARGAGSPGLIGWYVYGDYCGGQIWGLRERGPGRWTSTRLLESGLRISSFGEDEEGGLYVVHHEGVVFRITTR